MPLKQDNLALPFLSQLSFGNTLANMSYISTTAFSSDHMYSNNKQAMTTNMINKCKIMYNIKVNCCIMETF